MVQRSIEANYVDVENRRGAQEAVTHLLRLGHRRIAHIAGPLDTVCARDRLQGYYDALRTRGQSVDPDLVVEGDFAEATGYYLMRRLLPSRPSAVFAANDLMALGAIRALREGRSSCARGCGGGRVRRHRAGCQLRPPSDHGAPAVRSAWGSPPRRR